MRTVPIAVMLALLAVAGPPAALPSAAAPPADPIRMFEGRSHGDGRLRLLSRPARKFHVDSVGTRQADGSFRLEQVVTFEGEAPSRRHWVLRALAPGRYRFDLSDARGPGTARVDGPQLQLDYPLGHGLRMRQWLVPGADGRIANRGSIRWLGIPIGHLQETIVREPPSADGAR